MFEVNLRVELCIWNKRS